MSDEPKTIGLWRGVPCEALSHDELLGVIECLGREIAELRKLPVDYSVLVRQRVTKSHALTKGGCDPYGCEPPRRIT